MAIRALIRPIPLDTERIAQLEKIAGEKEKELAAMRVIELK
jgi:hypothetical protein